MGCLMQLRKVCNHPDLFETRAVRTSWAVSAEPVSAYGACEALVRRLLGSSLAAPQQLQPMMHAPQALMAVESARRLDATALLLRRGLHSARSALLDCGGAADRRWAELQMRPVRTTYYRTVAEHSAQQQQNTRARRAATWLRMAQNNHARLPSDLLGAVDICRRATLQQESSRREQLVALGLVLPTRQRIDGCRSVVERFAFVTPRVVAVPCGAQAMGAVHVHVREENYTKWGERWAYDMLPSVLHVQRRVAKHTGLLRPSEVRRQIAFPEPSLLQYDCGKLQALDRLVPQMVREGHRVQREKRWLSSIVMRDTELAPGESSEDTSMRASDWYDLAGDMLAGRSVAERPAKGMSEGEAQRLLAAAEDEEADKVALSAAIAEAKQQDAVDREDAGDADESVDNRQDGEDKNSAAGASAQQDNGEDDADSVGHIDDYMLRFVNDVLNAQDAERET
ncbi:swr1 complex component [Coemansia sp. RSA 2603]|nr:swr1 complex component [Coemansia sp. RSA 2603]